MNRWVALKKSGWRIIAAVFVVGIQCHVWAQLPPPGGGGGSGPTYTPLDSWWFNDHTNWTSDQGFAPSSFANLAFSSLGNGASLVVDSASPAGLRYHVRETGGATNLTVNQGSVLFWFAPASWSGTNAGGTGPGEWGRLLEVGSYTADSSYGFWSLYVDPAGTNLYFSAQTNNLSGTLTTYLSAPITWVTNYFHFIALTYSPTNTALYIDGTLATNGPGLTVYPGSNVLANGFGLGSDTNGAMQAHGLFNHLVTYAAPLDADTIQQRFNREFAYCMMNPLNTAMFKLTSADSTPAFTADYSAITGAGNLQWVAGVSVPTGGNVWLTNLTATAAAGDTMNTTFTIAGGTGGLPYDVFAASYLESGIWVWLGQGTPGNRYTVAVPGTPAFFILGTPLDSDGDGLSDAYEKLVSHTDPTQAQSDANGVPYAWFLQNGLSPQAGGQDPDRDGLMNYQEYQYGTKPKVSEGFSIWIGAVNGAAVIP